MSTHNTNTKDLIFNLIYTAEQIWIYHVLTKSYAEHKALGEIYDSVQSYKDAVAENLIGQEQMDSLSGSIRDSFNENITSAIDLLRDLKGYLEEFFGDDEEESGWSCDLLNMKDDMVGKINHTIYLLGLK